MRRAHDALVSAGANLRQPHLSGDLPNIFGHSARTIAMDDFIGVFLQCRTTPTDRNSNLARRQQVMIVLGVANPNRVVRRKSEYVQDLLQAGALADSRRKHHETAAVEQQRELQFELPDYLKNLWSRSCIAFNDAFADLELDPTAAQLVEEHVRRAMTSEPDLPIRKGLDGSIFGYHRINKVEIPSYPLQVRENTAGGEDDHDSSRTSFRDRGSNLRI